ncbi:MAG: thymidine phosphorylase [Acidobacteriota bacterium]
MKNFNMYEIISKKKDGKGLDKNELQSVIDSYVDGNIPDYQISALLMAIFLKGMNKDEVSDLTGIMLRSGDTITLDYIEGPKVDKHSTGGVGDKVSFIVSPIVAACGVKVPMLSGRALGHTGGTLDKLESIPGFNVFLKVDEFKDVLNKCGMVISGQTDNIVPADKKLYALRDSTATVNSIPLITSSIMSKKLALGTDAIVLDVKTGRGAFLPDPKDGISLCKSMVDIGEKNNRKTIGLITNMDQPLGNAVGNSLEIIESIECLKGNGPNDLMEVTLALGACMLSAAGVEKNITEGIEKLKKTIRSGEALKIFKKFIRLQNGNGAVCEDYSLFGKSKYTSELAAKRDGFIESIDAYETGMAAIDIGAGRRKKEDSINHTAGFVFNKKTGDKVKEGDILVTIQSDSEESAETVKERLSNAIKIVPGNISKPEMIKYIADREGLKSWDLKIDPSV